MYQVMVDGVAEAYTTVAAISSDMKK